MPSRDATFFSFSPNPSSCTSSSGTLILTDEVGLCAVGLGSSTIVREVGSILRPCRACGGVSLIVRLPRPRCVGGTRASCMCTACMPQRLSRTPRPDVHIFSRNASGAPVALSLGCQSAGAARDPQKQLRLHGACGRFSRLCARQEQ